MPKCYVVGIFMTKYSYEFKKKVVLGYLKGEGEQGSLMKRYDILLEKEFKTGLQSTNNSEMKD